MYTPSASDDFLPPSAERVRDETARTSSSSASTLLSSPAIIGVRVRRSARRENRLAFRQSTAAPWGVSMMLACAAAAAAFCAGALQVPSWLDAHQPKSMLSITTPAEWAGHNGGLHNASYVGGSYVGGRAEMQSNPPAAPCCEPPCAARAGRLSSCTGFWKIPAIAPSGVLLHDKLWATNMVLGVVAALVLLGTATQSVFRAQVLCGQAAAAGCKHWLSNGASKSAPNRQTGAARPSQRSVRILQTLLLLLVRSQPLHADESTLQDNVPAAGLAPPPCRAGFAPATASSSAR